MSQLPAAQLVRRGEARRFLGVSDESFSKLVKSGVLKPWHCPKRLKMRRHYFLTADLLKLVQTTKP